LNAQDKRNTNKLSNNSIRRFSTFKTNGHQWTSNKIRSSFLDYFESKRHKIIPSSSLVPMDDPSLLFTNAGLMFEKLFSSGERK